ncbi:MAG: hypothetical protein NTV58_15565 [Deltaproteobacteria bacterium]|nr:hypothetical protein [Deltaproteobacteria bacterium]
MKAKKKIGERAATILTETSVNAKDSSQITAQKDEVHNTKGGKPMVEETIKKQWAKWPEMMMGMLNNMPAFTSSNKAMEPFMQMMKMQQQHGMNMCRTWIDQLGKIGEASRSGDVKKVWETCMESNKEVFNTCQEAMKEQATAHYEFLRTFIPPTA